MSDDQHQPPAAPSTPAVTPLPSPAPKPPADELSEDQLDGLSAGLKRIHL